MSRRLYVDERLSVVAIAARYGCSQETVAKTLARHGIVRDRSWNMDAATLRTLYVEQRLDDKAIGARYRVPPWWVRKRRQELNVRRPPASPPRNPPAMPTAEELREWYVGQGRTLVDIAKAHHTSVRVVREWMRAAGVQVKARTSRNHRRDLDPGLLRRWYVEREWSATAIAAELDTTVHLVLRAMHDYGIPVRSTRGDHAEPYQLLQALYDDDQVIDLLARHQIPVRARPGPIAGRFPTPAPLSTGLLQDAYLGLGLSARHIELLTGQPADQVLDALHAAGIPVRTHNGRSPWLRATQSSR